MNNGVLRMNGLTVYPSADVPDQEPRLALSNSVDVSLEFRRRFSAWSIARFGGVDCAYRMGRDIYISPRNFEKLRQTQRTQGGE